MRKYDINKVSSGTDWHPRALYVVNPVRFRQIAAGISTFLWSLALDFEAQILLVGYPAKSLSAAFNRPSLSCQPRPR